MTQEQLTAFITNAKGNTSLQEKLKDAVDVDAIAAITRKLGFSISAGDLKIAQSKLSDKELEGVAGSGGDWKVTQTWQGGTCLRECG